MTIAASTTLPALPAADAAPTTLWGLSPRQLHDAYWRSKGVQCVRRGRRQKLLRGADLYLLIEPQQLVLFNISQMAERLTWHNAVVTRLRLTEEGQERYSEHVVTDVRGHVQRIERRYRPRVQGSSRVLLTSSRRVASIWMTARNGRDGWDRVRRSVPWARVDHGKCAGITFVDGNAGHERRLLDELVEHWPHPDQSINGLEELDTGVWHVAGESIAGGIVRIGPLWLGCGSGNGQRLCIVGPAWVADQARLDARESRNAALKDIAEIELPDTSPELVRVPVSSPGYQIAKRLFDIVGSALALVMLMPVLVLIAAAVVIESGLPLFFGHTRQGRGGKLFRCWKFRTMHRDAEKMARQLDDNVCDGPQVYVQNDPRATKVGRVLRRFNLDELPQFWNVLIGQMSLVGPRPSPDDENQYCPAWRDLRLSVRPGITGLWQLNRTREPGEDFQEWIKYDIEYVRTASLGLDLAILFRTALMLLLGRSNGAND